MAKKHHMTKRQYTAYKKTHRRYSHSVEVEQEEIRHTKSNQGKYSKKREKEVKNQLRNIQGDSGETLGEEYDDEKKIARTLEEVKEPKQNLSASIKRISENPGNQERKFPTNSLSPRAKIPSVYSANSPAKLVEVSSCFLEGNHIRCVRQLSSRNSGITATREPTNQV